MSSGLVQRKGASLPERKGEDQAAWLASARSIIRPNKSILDKTFVYSPSHLTNVKATWERVANEEKEAAAQAAKDAEFNQHRIVAIGRKRA